MVYLRPSTGCQNCRKRHIKCDESNSVCQKCIKAGLICPGYRDAQDVFFKDVTAIVTRKHALAARRRVAADPKPSHCIQEDFDTVSIGFLFGRYLTTQPRRSPLSTGHFDHIAALYSKSRSGSPLALAFTLLANKAMCRFFRQASPSRVIKNELAAIASLKHALEQADEQAMDETLLAVLCLDLAEEFQEACPTRFHANGAFNLVVDRNANSFSHGIPRSLCDATLSVALSSLLEMQDAASQDTLIKFPRAQLPQMGTRAALSCLLQRTIRLEWLVRNKLSKSVQELKDVGAQLQEVIDGMSRWSVACWQLWGIDLEQSAPDIIQPDPERIDPLDALWLAGMFYCTRLTILGACYVLATESVEVIPYSDLDKQMQTTLEKVMSVVRELKSLDRPSQDVPDEVGEILLFKAGWSGSTYCSRSVALKYVERLVRWVKLVIDDLPCETSVEVVRTRQNFDVIGMS